MISEDANSAGNKPGESVALRVEDCSLQLGGNEILRAISFEVREGESVCVIGPNGAGKSSLLRCLDGLERRFTGGVSVFGRPLASYSRRKFAAEVSYVPQAVDHWIPFTAREFVLMGRYPHLTPWTSASDRDRIATDEALDLSGARPFAERMLPTLSGGERQQVYLAAALAQQAKILLWDEPTTYLDYQHQEKIVGLLSRLNRELGTTVISVSHDVNQACLLSERILAIKQGRLAFDGSGEELMSNDVLEGIYDKPFEFVSHPRTGRTMILPRDEPR
ncbi:MAG: ABC transporter ATP-binding protein [Planctomycetales bacterium]